MLVIKIVILILHNTFYKYLIDQHKVWISFDLLKVDYFL